jgi:hypothetical protein
MKGFIKILEAVLASLILLSSLTYFFLPAMHSRWNDAMLQTSAQDSIAVLYKNGSLERMIRDNDNENVTLVLKSLFPRTADFSIEINGIAKPNIHVGCLCSSKEKADLESILYPTLFKYNERSIDILVTNGSLDYLANSDIDIIIFFVYRAFSSAEKDKIIQFLGNGKSLMMIANLTNGQVNDGFINETFGLMTTAYTGTSSSSVFYKGDAGKPPFKISRYYYWIGDSNTFNFSKESSINSVAVDDRTIVKTYDGLFSSAKLNYNIINNSGRTVWISDYSYGDGPIKNLTKAAILWASGESFKMDPYLKNPPEVQSSFVYRYIGTLGTEPFELSLRTWRIFY